jgi:hypothetical protein
MRTICLALANILVDGRASEHAVRRPAASLLTPRHEPIPETPRIQRLSGPSMVVQHGRRTAGLSAPKVGVGTRKREVVS